MAHENFLDLFDTVAQLKEVELFKETDVTYLFLIANYVKRRIYMSGEILCEEGKREGKLFFLLSGRVAIKKAGKTINECIAGECIGELSFLDKQPHTATVVATMETQVMCLSNHDFKKILIMEPRVSDALARVLVARLRQLLSQSSNEQG